MKDDGIVGVRCAACGADRGDVRRTPADTEVHEPCTCGASAVIFDVRATDEASVREMVVLKARDQQAKEPHLIVKWGSSFFARESRWHELDRRIDRANDRYDEVITDEETGEVVREVHEPLHEHQGRGSARLRDTGDDATGDRPRGS